MSQPEIFSENEQDKLARLEKLIKPDTLPNELFNKINLLAEELFNVPQALIRVVSEDKNWYSSIAVSEVDDKAGIDSWLRNACLRSKSSFDIPDSFQVSNVNYSSNNEDNLITKFYIAAPIHLSDGKIIGALCLIDNKQIHLNEYQKNIFKCIASMASEALVLKISANEIIDTKNRKLSAIVEFSDDAIVSKTLDGVVVSWNQSAERLFGYSADEMVGRSITTIFPHDKMKEEAYFIKQIKNNLHINHYETERLNKNGDTVSISVSLSPIKDEHGDIIGISKIARDISAKRLLQQKLEAEHERLRVTMDSIGDAVITTDENGIVLYQNPIAEKLTGWHIEEAIGMPLFKVFNIVNEKSHLPVENPVEVCINENRIVGLAHHTLLISQNGSQYGIEDSAAPIRDNSGKIIGAVLVFHDVTTQRKMANEMTYRATHDSLTGLLNRVEFEYVLAELLKNVREPRIEHALIYIDLDQFKIINDTCGHSAGDEVLKDISRVMESCIRNTDKLARIGGDEFAIILERCDDASAIRIAELLCKSIDEYRFQYINKRFHIGASVGLVLIDKTWPSVTSLIQAADSACYAAKENGRNRVQVHFETDSTLASRREEIHWVACIEQAFDNDNFQLYCQRIVPLNNQNTIHGEVLLRMKDDLGGTVPPGAFLPAAERFHIATRIDRWVVTEVFSWLKTHHHELRHIENISINLSGQSISDRDFHTFVINLIKEITPDCSKICFEITETAAITNISEASRFIELMKQLGIKFSLDDFGSGVSSFGYLKSLSVEYLKIDGQFIRGIIEDSIDQATVRCILEIAKATGKQTIAECVETEPVENMLKEMGVDFIQGYLRHRPEPIDEILKI